MESENYYYNKEKGILRIQEMKEPIIYNSNLMRKVISETKTLSRYNVPVLIRGETGTGKGLIAKAVHYFNKSSKKFTKVNCSSLVENLFESEIFGHVQGAFTGAIYNKEGILSSKGTVFLDEIGDIPLSSQTSLLSAIEDKEFRKVGQGNGNTQKLTSRIITATNSNLEKEIENNNFRKDLYYRLNIGEIQIPPLRERKEDIKLLIDYFLDSYNKEMKKQVTLTKDAEKELFEYYFPGNTRELQNIIQRTVMRTKNGKPCRSLKRDLNKKRDSIKKIKIENMKGDNYRELINDFKLKLITKTLEENQFNLSATARSLEITNNTIHRFFSRLNINLKDLRRESI